MGRGGETTSGAPGGSLLYGRRMRRPDPLSELAAELAELNGDELYERAGELIKEHDDERLAAIVTRMQASQELFRGAAALRASQIYISVNRGPETRPGQAVEVVAKALADWHPDPSTFFPAQGSSDHAALAAAARQKLTGSPEPAPPFNGVAQTRERLAQKLVDASSDERPWSKEEEQQALIALSDEFRCERSELLESELGWLAESAEIRYDEAGAEPWAERWREGAKTAEARLAARGDVEHPTQLWELNERGKIRFFSMIAARRSNNLDELLISALVHQNLTPVDAPAGEE